MNLDYECICGAKLSIQGQRFDLIEADIRVFRQLMHEHLNHCKEHRENYIATRTEVTHEDKSSEEKLSQGGISHEG